jgi:hypothetical protein
VKHRLKNFKGIVGWRMLMFGWLVGCFPNDIVREDKSCEIEKMSSVFLSLDNKNEVNRQHTSPTLRG